MSGANPIRNVRAEGRAATRKGLLEIASGLLEQEGADALSMRRIAKLAGCSTSVLYTQFGGKEGLAAGLYEEGFERLEAALKDVKETEPLEQVRQLNRAYRQVALANPTYYAVMFGRPIPEFTPSAEQREVAWRSMQPLIQALGGCRSKGVLTAKPEAMAMKLWTLAHGLVSAEISGHLPYDKRLPAELHETVMNDLFEAWGLRHN